MANQRKLWSDPKVVETRRSAAEAVLGREMEMPGRQYSDVERRLGALHLASVIDSKKRARRSAA